MASYNTLSIYFDPFKILYYHFYLFSPQILNELCAGHSSVRAGNTSIDKVGWCFLSKSSTHDLVAKKSDTTGCSEGQVVSYPPVHPVGNSSQQPLFFTQQAVEMVVAALG